MSTWKVEGTADGRRLDALVKSLAGIPDMKSARRLVESGRCRVNGRQVTRSSHRCQKGDEISADVPATSMLKTLWTDQGLVAVDKPRGLECSLAASSPLRQALAMAGLGDHELAHRLDADTTGLLLMSTPDKSELAQDLFREQACRKTYLALVQGIPDRDEMTLTGRIARLGIVKGRPRFGLAPEGLEAVTLARVLARSRKARCALVAFEPRTGRTHQIRIQAASWGHPLMGDTLYGTRQDPPWIPGLMLHAHRLEFTLPGQDSPTLITAPPPEDFRRALHEAGIDPDLQAPDPHNC